MPAKRLGRAPVTTKERRRIKASSYLHAGGWRKRKNAKREEKCEGRIEKLCPGRGCPVRDVAGSSLPAAGGADSMHLPSIGQRSQHLTGTNNKHSTLDRLCCTLSCSSLVSRFKPASPYFLVSCNLCSNVITPSPRQIRARFYSPDWKQNYNSTMEVLLAKVRL